MEILFHSEATPRVNMLMTKLKNPATAQIKSVDSFIKENGMHDDVCHFSYVIRLCFEIGGIRDR